MTEEETTSRVSMVWPADLKERVRQVAGARGLTEFTIAAVERELAGNLPPRPALTPGRVPPMPVTRPAHQVSVVGSTEKAFGVAVPPEPELLVTDEERCPECKTPLIAGECWTCGA